MQKELLRPIVIFPLIILLILIMLVVKSVGHESAGPEQSSAKQTNPLSISQDGSQATTNVSGADLQQAAPPARSVTSTDVSPQQAAPYQEGL